MELKNMAEDKNLNKVEVNKKKRFRKLPNTKIRLIKNYCSWKFASKAIKKRKPKRFLRFLTDLTERFGSLFAHHKILNPEN